ncbi:MAG: arginine--tRNA ligase [Actinomycetota bacterium]|nr:arginine--tRNA ligase [Actinomycetota bacterium]
MALDPLSELRAATVEAVSALGIETAQELTLVRPKRAEHGDYSINAAMLLAPVLAEPARKIAERLGDALTANLGSGLERIEVAGPGHLNVFLSDAWYRAGVASILASENFGAGPTARPSVLLEFVSANPTGPLTAASGRGAAYGDSLARILEASGHEVSREYYLNDSGTQIRSFAASIAARMRGEEPPESGYAGAYVTELASVLREAGADPSDLDDLGRRGVEAMRKRIGATLERFGVRFDTWSSERDLNDRGALESTLMALGEAGHTYESEGALWLRTSEFGDDKDRVLVRSDGEPTYFASDIAYHRDKLDRGTELMIDPLGADHHGYVPRMKAAVAMLSGDPDRYEAPIMQLINIVERGARSRMSKRKGEFVTLDELISDIGVDATRFFLLQRSHDTPIDLDLELARSQSQENPVYYVQYAHARIASIVRKAAREDARAEPQPTPGSEHAQTELPYAPGERALVRRLLDLPAEVSAAADRRSPHRLCAYASAVAADFHAFYRDCRVVGADAETGIEGLEAARLDVCLATQRVIGGTLGLLGISAPEHM